jgi:hypothetical protein
MKLILKYLFISLCFLYPQEKVFYLKYEKAQDHIYKDQIFRVNLNLLAFDDSILHIESDMSNYYGIKIFNNSMQWTYKDNEKDKFKAFLYLKALSTRIKLPDINLTITGYDDKYYQNIQGNIIQAKKLNWLDYSSHLISSSLKVLEYKSNIYDKGYNIISLKLKAKDANLKDLYIKNDEIVEQNITNIKNNYPYMTGEYSAIIPSYIKTFKFSYLNTTSNTFNILTFNVAINNKSDFLVEDINPDIKTYDKYKLILLLTVIVLSLFMSFYRKKISYLVIAFFLLLVLVRGVLFQHKAIISKGSKFRVLPIDTSTIFYISRKDREVVILNKVNHYIKIQFQNKVGWVNEEYIIKN